MVCLLWELPLLFTLQYPALSQDCVAQRFKVTQELVPESIFPLYISPILRCCAVSNRKWTEMLFLKRFVYLFYLPVCPYTTCVHCWWFQDRALEPMGVELETVLSYHVGAGHGTQVPWINSQ